MHEIVISYLFGSQREIGAAYLSGNEVILEEGSDLDLGVVFRSFPQDTYDAYGKLYSDIESYFRPFELDIVFLQETDPLFQYEAIKGHLLYYEKESMLDNYEEYVLKLASDQSFKREEFQKDIIEAIKHGYIKVKH